MKTNDFDFIAPFYDGISKLIFGNQLLKSQQHFLNEIKPTDHILILGGGSGKILESLPTCRQVDYVEKSDQMIALARRRSNTQKVSFFHGDFLKLNTMTIYDVIICPFFLDCFKPSTLSEVLVKIRKLMHGEGKLIICDFDIHQSNPFILYIMHVFFRLFSNLEANNLSDIHHFLLETGFSVEKEKYFYQKMIFSRLYRNL